MEYYQICQLNHDPMNCKWLRFFFYAVNLSIYLLVNKTGNVRITSHWGAFCNHCCSGKAISITYYKCVIVVLVIQPAMLVRHIVICGLPGSTLFFHIIVKRQEFRKMLLDIEYIFGFSLHLSSEIFLILRRTEQNLIKILHWFPCKVPVILVRY